MTRSALLILLLTITTTYSLAEEEPVDDGKISYYEQIRPIFQANCQGCHQPAKSGGDYVMTSFEKLLTGGESESAAIVAQHPDKSYLVELITSVDGKAEMPKGQKPLAESDVDLITRWIAEGAVDDTPDNAKQRYDTEHPPVYTRAPVITSIDFSPDGQVLAIAGFHEVLLHKADGSASIGRLVGVSERIESVRFSPDGKRLVVTGGLPGRMGEVQVWDLAEQKLLLSVSVTYDTVYGGSWSPDGKLIAFGCADNTVRAINSETGEQVLFQGAHNDWVRNTVFSVDGSHLVSVGRDMSVKLTEVATERFVDNVSSITPGALKGGVQAVSRHPQRDEVIIGGSDGVVKVYRMHRLTKRVIGDDANLIRKLPGMTGRVFSTAVSRDGNRIVAGSSLDGKGQIHVYGYEFDTSMPANIKKINEKVVTQRNAEEKKTLDDYHAKDVKLVADIALPQAAVYSVAFQPDGKAIAAAGSDGVIRLFETESGSLLKEFAPAPISDEVTNDADATDLHVDFIRDVNPVLSRLGCNAGTCHGSLKGKNGFKLSLRGYDAIFDTRALTDDLASRRVNVASPDDSLMLLKSTGAVPHVGGQLVKPEDDYYKLIRNWIAGGAKLDLASSRVTKIVIEPINPVIQKIGDLQQMKVVATYSDGTTRDVTHEAFIESGNSEVATADRAAAMTSLRRGEAAVLARYEGAYAATTLTVMGDREKFAWSDPEKWGRIDELTAEKWKRVKTLPSELCTDNEFVRRVYLDLTGLPPSSEDVRKFIADDRDSRVKRDELVDQLVDGEEFIEHWTNKWADLLQVNRKFLGPEGSAAFRAWIRAEVAANTPYDEFARKILTASGSNRENPAASYYKILRDPADTMENTTHLFLAVRFNCNKCHDHPFERWTQDQYYETAAFFAQYGLKADPAAGDRKIGGTAVEGAKPFYEVVYDKNEGDITHERTKQVAPPEFPFECNYQATENASRREQLAAWITSADNQYFARSYVNRLWGYMFGVGIIEPIDDIRAGNPPSNPELLDHLTKEFVDSKFDVRHLIRSICKARTYQLSIEANQWNQDDTINYSHATARRLPAEVLYDAIQRVTGSSSHFPGVPAGTRAAALPDAGVKLPSGFLTTFGKPPRESACECERSNGVQLGPVMALVSGPVISDAIADPSNDLVKLVASEKDDTKLINELFLRVLNRPAEEAEIHAAIDSMNAIDADHQLLLAALKERQAYWAEQKPKLEKDREQAMAKAKADLAAYETQIAPMVAEQETQRAAKIKAAEQDLTKYDAVLPQQLTAWEKKSASAIEWHLLDPAAVTGSGTMKLVRLPDRSVKASGGDRQASYVITVHTGLKNITGVRLEALTDPDVKGNGPGIPENGNFAVTEFQVDVASKSKPNEFKKATLKNPRVDFNQEGFNQKLLVDGVPGNQNAWAVNPAGGVTHWATFEAEKPIGFDEGTVLRFIINQNHAAAFHLLARFRISVTTEKHPLALSLPESLKAVVLTDVKQRTEAQKTLLMTYFQKTDPGRAAKVVAVAEAKKPVPVDPGVASRRQTIEYVSQPVPEDAVLVQLRNDVAMSQKQLENKRLTAAQDLTWALINSPAFLFNH